MTKYFKIETDVAQNLIDDFFLTLTVKWPLGRILSEKKYVGTGLISEKKTEALCVELNEKVEAASSSYSATSDFFNILILWLWLTIIRRSELGV